MTHRTSIRGVVCLVALGLPACVGPESMLVPGPSVREGSLLPPPVPNPAVGDDSLFNGLTLPTVFISAEPPLAGDVIPVNGEYLPDSGLSGSSFLFLESPQP